MAFETDNSSMPDAEVRRQEGRAYPTTWLEAWRVRARLRNGSGGRCGGGQGGVDGREGDFSSDRLMEATLRAGVPDNPVPLQQVHSRGLAESGAGCQREERLGHGGTLSA